MESWIAPMVGTMTPWLDPLGASAVRLSIRKKKGGGGSTGAYFLPGGKTQGGIRGEREQSWAMTGSTVLTSPDHLCIP